MVTGNSRRPNVLKCTRKLRVKAMIRTFKGKESDHLTGGLRWWSSFYICWKATEGFHLCIYTHMPAQAQVWFRKVTV
jgi:hypothetical protein